MVGTITTSGAILAKAGKNHSTDLDTGWSATSEFEEWIEETEAFLINTVKFDIVTNWTSLNAIYKLMFSEYASRMLAVNTIFYDPSGYTDGIEAENMAKIHWQRSLDIMKLLNQADVQDFMAV